MGMDIFGSVCFQSDDWLSSDLLSCALSQSLFCFCQAVKRGEKERSRLVFDLNLFFFFFFVYPPGLVLMRTAVSTVTDVEIKRDCLAGAIKGSAAPFHSLAPHPNCDLQAHCPPPPLSHPSKWKAVPLCRDKSFSHPLQQPLRVSASSSFFHKWSISLVYTHWWPIKIILIWLSRNNWLNASLCVSVGQGWGVGVEGLWPQHLK